MGDPDCVFCAVVAGSLPAEIVDEDDRTLALMDISPATRGHALVIPRAHVADLRTADPEDLASVAATAQRLARRAHDAVGADGVTIMSAAGAAAWQTVFHFHVHVIPRYAGDPLRLPWTPAPGDAEEIAAAAAAWRA